MPRHRFCAYLPVALVSLTLPALAAAPGTFEAVSDMNEGRNYPRATSLADGTVLVTGGETRSPQGDYHPVTSAERFDPNTNSFSPAGKTRDARMAHTAVRLQDGRVLVLGGLGSSGSLLSSAEVFDPESNQFTPVGEMTDARILATAVLLQNGQVLVVGGFGGSDESRLKTAELFDPASGTFKATGGMARARLLPAVIPLGDGRLVVLGGDEESPTVEIYDPAAGQFTTQGRTTAPRPIPTATLRADGKIVVAGGASLNVEVYDPATGQSQRIGAARKSRLDQPGVVLADGRILLAGGWGSTSSTRPQASVEVVDPATGQVTETGPMVTPRSQGAAVLLQDGRALFVGGQASTVVPGTPLRSAEVYIP